MQPKKKNLDGFSPEYFKPFKEELTKTLFKLLCKIATGRMFPKSFYEDKLLSYQYPIKVS